MPAFWMVLGALLTISALLNGAAFVNADATGTRVFRGILSVVLLAAARRSARGWPTWAARPVQA